MTSVSRVAVIAGANQGLGFALAEGLAQRLALGDIVYVTGRNAERLTDAAALERVTESQVVLR
jgi:NAD(P)-dependent dehydrogenase (short-subunit alcohol dehydrogenase family)